MAASVCVPSSPAIFRYRAACRPDCLQPAVYVHAMWRYKLVCGPMLFRTFYHPGIALPLSGIGYDSSGVTATAATINSL